MKLGRKFGHIVTEKTREKLRNINLGNKASKETREKMSNSFKEGYANGTRKSYWLGKELSKEHKDKQSKALKDKSYEELFGKEKANKLKEIRKNYNKGQFKNEDIRIVGKNNINWNNGSSFEPYGIEFNKLFKNKIRQRDNQVCMNCGIHREKLNRTLSVHHINYDKQLSIKENCISLCLNCHSLTNLNKDYWIRLFQNKLSNLYQYRYENNNPIINLEVIKG